MLESYEKNYINDFWYYVCQSSETSLDISAAWLDNVLIDSFDLCYG